MAGTARALGSYSGAAIALHWVIALAIFGQLIGIEYAESLPKGDPALPFLFMMHKSTGLTILGLTLVRVIMRLQRGFLPLPVHMSGWEVALARASHVGFYALLLLMPLTGWIFSVSAERTFDWYGLFAVPPLPLRAFAETAHELHEWGATAFLVLIGLHIAGALKHQFLDRDGLMRRMLPGDGATK
ncbi:MAG: cytochrome b [Pseudomonadota bacterium]